MLVVAGPHHAVVQYDEAVAWPVLLMIGAHCADHHIQFPHAAGDQLTCQLVGLIPSGIAERGAQGEILDRIAGQRHLGEHHHLGVVGRRLTGVLQHLVGVALQVADTGVDLRECETNIGHAHQSIAGSVTPYKQCQWRGRVARAALPIQ